MNTKTIRPRSKLLIVLFFIVALLVLWSPVPAESGKTGQQDKAQIARIQRQTRQALDGWSAEEQKLVAQITRLEEEVKQIRREREKFATYRKTVATKLALLQTAEDEQTNIKAHLLPFLDEQLGELENRINRDLPFDRSKRLHQLTMVRQILNDPDIELPAKTNAFLKALDGEVKQGHVVVVSEADIRLGGNPIRVKLLRLGRLGLYALRPDGRQAYCFFLRSREFQAVPRTADEIRKAIEIAEHRRLAQLIRLPLPSTGGATHE